MNALKLDYEIFPAINGRTNKHELLAKYNESKRLNYRGNQLTAGQLGCYASHYLM